MDLLDRSTLPPVDWMLFGKWSGTEIKVDGEDVVIMTESDIMGIVERDAASTRKAA